MSSALLPCPRCGAANDPRAERCHVCGHPLPAEPSAERDPIQPLPPLDRSPRTLHRRVVVAGIAGGAVIVFGGSAYMAYTLAARERYGPRPPTLTYTGHTFARDAVWSPDGTRVASTGWPYAGGADSRAVHIWDAATGKRLLICTLEDAAAGRTPAGVVWSADGGRLLAVVEGPASSSIDRVQVWDAATGQQVRSVPVLRTATAWALNERYLALATHATHAAQQQGALQMHAVRGPLIMSTPAPPVTPTPAATPPATPTPTSLPAPTPVAPTPVPSPPDVIEVLELATGVLVATLTPDGSSALGSVEKLIWAPGSSKLAVSTPPSVAVPSSYAWHIWDAPARRELQTIGIPTQEYDVLAWSPDEHSLALGAAVYDVESARRMATYQLDGYLIALAWAPDGRHIAVWARTGTGLYATKYDLISLVEASGGRQVARYDGGVSETAAGPLGSQSRLEWSPDGKRLLVVRNGVEVWSLGSR